MKPQTENNSNWKSLKHLVTGRLVVLKKFEDKKYLREIRNATGKSLLHVACKHGFVPVCRYLLEEVACDINLRDEKNGHTPWVVALQRGDEESAEVVELLLAYDADGLPTPEIVFKTSGMGKSLSVALSRLHNNNLTVAANFLLKRNWSLVDVSRLQNSKLTESAVKLLIERGANVSFERVGPSIYAHEKAAQAFCSELKRQKKSAGQAASYLVRKGWSLDQVACLLDSEITDSVLKSDRSMHCSFQGLMLSVEQQNVSNFARFLQKVAKSKRLTSLALRRVTEVPSPKSVLFTKLLLDFGAPLNGFVIDETTPLEQALRSLNIRCSRLLMERGARLPNLDVFRFLREEIRRAKSRDATKCVYLILDYHGLWKGDSTKNFESIYWLEGNYQADYPILAPVLSHLSVQRQSAGQDDDFFPFPYSDGCRRYFMACSNLMFELNQFRLYENRRITLLNLFSKTLDELAVFAKDDLLFEKIRVELTKLNYHPIVYMLLLKLDDARKKNFLIKKFDGKVTVLSSVRIFFK